MRTDIKKKNQDFQYQPFITAEVKTYDGGYTRLGDKCHGFCCATTFAVTIVTIVFGIAIKFIRIMTRVVRISLACLEDYI